MSEAISVAFITSGVSLIGSILTMIVSIVKNKQSNNVTLYRIDELEKKVSKHNNLVERMYKLEHDEALVKQRVGDVEKDVDNLRKGH